MSVPRAGAANQRRSDTWPPSPIRQPPSLEEDLSTDDDELDIALLQRDPMTYFLTPPTPMEEELEFEFDFDAGIEDSNNPREIVRSVSPSTLDGLKRYKPKGKQTDCAIMDEDDGGDEDDEEDYIRFGSKKFHMRIPDIGYDQPRGSGSPGSRLTEALLSPASFHVGSPRGRSAKRFSPPRRPFQGNSAPLRRRHSWREPSPDVWSIEEEPEKETMSERGFSTEDLEALGNGKAHPIDIPAAKPKKKVRFVLPDTA